MILCNLELLPNKISDDRKVVPQPVVSEASQLTKLETAPHKVSYFDDISSVLCFAFSSRLIYPPPSLPSFVYHAPAPSTKDEKGLVM